MIRLYILPFILLLFTVPAYAQSGNVVDLGDKLFFNILTHKPDSSVYDFVKRYFPGFTDPDQKGGWTSYGGSPDVAVYDTTIHSLLFFRHPFFKAKFTEGRLEFFTRENRDHGPGIMDLQIWFIFKNQKDANNAFKALCDSFARISKFHKVEKKSNKIIAGYSDKEKPSELDCNQLILLPDELFKGRFKILFRLWPL